MCSVCCIMPNIVGHTGPPMWTQSSGLYKGLFWGNKRTARLENDNNFAPSLNEPLHSYYPERNLVFIANDNNLCLLSTILSSTCLCWWFECFLVRKSKTEEEKNSSNDPHLRACELGWWRHRWRSVNGTLPLTEHFLPWLARGIQTHWHTKKHKNLQERHKTMLLERQNHVDPGCHPVVIGVPNPLALEASEPCWSSATLLLPWHIDTQKNTKTCMKRINNVVRKVKPC